MKALNDNAHPLESLLQQHCPNGVEFKELGELGEFSNTGVDKKKNEKEKEVILLNFVDVMKNHYIDEKIPTMIVTASDNKIKQCTCEKGDIFITPSSETIDEIGFASVITKTLSNTCYSYHIMRYRLFEKQITTSFFIRYLFESEIIRQQIRKYATGLTRFGLKKQKWEQIKIPLPPLEIQSKIVEILDAFTELEAELQVELEARLKQYHYYRNKLLSHDELENRTAKSRNDSDPTPLVPYVRLGEVCEKISNIKWKEMQNQTFKYIDLTSVDRENCQITQTQTITKENAPSRAQQIVQTDDVICGTTRPTLQRYCYITKQYDGQICSTGFCVLRANKTQILPKWIFFNLKTNNFLKHIERFQQGASYPSIADADLKKFQIPLPPLAVQNDIVELLDKFDTLTNDLTSGIPAEIEARKKQYEHYRERLLSFITKD
ncbi:restriction endonuclease subunit S [Campylobacter upsaliensis]|uniref:restriction endonuclease subunit S n=1 Tax=Campylobacter upsaliensis TaxID=28080 RepID=UPI00214A3DA0|nr:restriction endonuclease subunit S [Campylobacter upsaliensis]MCR2091177.1 restriction endonuclease subunit S [Campylobacter upsaliensis]